MKRNTALGLLLSGGALFLLWFFYFSKTTYALGSRDVELEFLILDAETGKPIPGAMVVMQIEDDDGKGNRIKWLRIPADNEGKARLVREQVSCEDIIRPFRGTKTLFDFTHYSYSISAPGYEPLADTDLHTTPFESQGYVDEGRFERLQFKITLAGAQAR
jgi:hypothetical protein